MVFLIGPAHESKWMVRERERGTALVPLSGPCRLSEEKHQTRDDCQTQLSPTTQHRTKQMRACVHSQTHTHTELSVLECSRNRLPLGFWQKGEESCNNGDHLVGEEKNESGRIPGRGGGGRKQEGTEWVLGHFRAWFSASCPLLLFCPRTAH